MLVFLFCLKFLLVFIFLNLFQIMIFDTTLSFFDDPLINRILLLWLIKHSPQIHLPTLPVIVTVFP